MTGGPGTLAAQPSPVHTSSRRLSMATLAQLVSRCAGALLGVVVAVELTRALPAADVGTLSLALLLLGLVTGVGDFGMTNVAVRQMAARRDDVPRLVGALLLVRLGVGLGLGAVLLAATALLLHDARLLPVVLVLAAAPLSAAGAFQTVGQARLRPGVAALLLLLQSVLWAVTVLLLGRAHATLAAFATAFLAVSVVQAAVTVAVGLRQTRVTRTGLLPGARSLLRDSWPVGLAGVFVTAYYRLDGVVVYQARGAEATAYYTTAYRFLDVLQLLPVTVLSVLLPLIARWHAGGAHEHRDRVLTLSLVLAGALGLPVAVGGLLLGPAVVDALYGPEYASAGPVLQVLSTAFFPIFLGYIATSVVLVLGAVRRYACVAGVAAVVNVVGTVALVPRWGLLAAAGLTVLTEAAVNGYLLTYATRRLGLRLPWRHWAGAAAAAAVTGLALACLHGASLPVALPAGAVVYLVSLWALGGLRADDLAPLLRRNRSLAW